MLVNIEHVGLLREVIGPHSSPCFRICILFLTEQVVRDGYSRERPRDILIRMLANARFQATRVALLLLWPLFLLLDIAFAELCNINAFPCLAELPELNEVCKTEI